MSDNIKAFPHPGNSNWRIEPEVGMDLRDWFAGQALSGLAQHDSLPWVDAAGMAYRAADAMMAERKKGGES